MTPATVEIVRPRDVDVVAERDFGALVDDGHAEDHDRHVVAQPGALAGSARR